jgi:hypothetical protein
MAPAPVGPWPGGLQSRFSSNAPSLGRPSSFPASDQNRNTAQEIHATIGIPQGITSPSPTLGNANTTPERPSANAQVHGSTSAVPQPEATGGPSGEAGAGDRSSSERQGVSSPSLVPGNPIPTTAPQPAAGQTGAGTAADPRPEVTGRQSEVLRGGIPGRMEPNEDGGPNVESALPRDPLNTLIPRDLKKKPTRPLPFTGLLSGNRDWIISVECHADAVVVLPSRQRIPTAQFAGSQHGSNPLRELVEQMIARRQGSIRAGEMPYRPMIRFKVWPEGVRTYYLAYPVLEGLRLPMRRENAEVEVK